MSRSVFIVAALLSLALATNAASARAYAHAAPGYAVEFRDLDLGRDRDRAELMRRLAEISERFCGEDATKTNAEHEQCIRRSVAEALTHAPGDVQSAMRGIPVTALAER